MKINQSVESKPRWQSLTLRFLLMISAVASQPGCTKQSAPTPSPAAAEQDVHVDWMMKARRQVDLGQHDAAAESVGRALIETPGRSDAIYLAAQIAALRGRAADAADLAALIPSSNDRFGIQAAELRVEQLVRAGQRETATELLFDLARQQPDQPAWRHLLWQQLTYQGRRQEASQQADQLCLLGQATLEEVQSLIARNEAYPSRLKDGEAFENRFAAGLGHARWHFTQGDYQRGLEALQEQSEHGFHSAAARALYGRMLAESQQFDQLSRWHAKIDDETRQLSDYWAAVGASLMAAGRHEAAARAFLEAITRDPTDRISYQRSYRSLAAMGRDKDAEQMLLLSNQVGTSQRLFADIQKSPADRSLWQMQAEWLTNIGRPLEAIAWYSQAIPANAVAQHQALRQHLAELQSMKNLNELQLSVVRAAIDPSKFSLQPALDETLGLPASDQATPDPIPASRRLKRHAGPQTPSAKPRLVDVASSIGVDFQWYHDTELQLELLSLYESLGGGIAVIDFDLDGWPDLYLAQGSGSPPAMQGTRSNLLFRNQAGRFADATSSSASDDHRYSQGVAAGDVNQDGFPDLFVGEIGVNRLLINNGDGTFTDQTPQLGDAGSRFTTSVAIADLNGDSLPELVEANYIMMDSALDPPRKQPDGSYEIPGPIVHQPESDWWYENLGNGSWRGKPLGETASEAGSGLGLMITDMDDRPGNEIFVANDARPNQFWIKTEAGNWVNAANTLGLAHGFEGLATAAMGIAAGDFDRNGQLDLQVTNFFNESSNLYLQTGEGGFVDLAVAYQLDRLSRPMVGFGTKAIDLDRNGWLDLIVSNGHVFDRLPENQAFRMPPQILMHWGDHFEQAEVDDPSGYFRDDYLGRAMACGDLDRDGRIDFVIGHLDRPLAVLHNETPSTGKWLQFELVGTKSERDSTGAVVTVSSGDQIWRAWVTAGDGYMCSDQPVLEFALGVLDKVDSVDIQWPSGRRTVYEDLELNARYLVIENESTPFARSIK